VPTAQTAMLFTAMALALNLTPGPLILFILSRCLDQGVEPPSHRFFDLQLPQWFRDLLPHLNCRLFSCAPR